jgi:hypothetical protein
MSIQGKASNQREAEAESETKKTRLSSFSIQNLLSQLALIEGYPNLPK